MRRCFSALLAVLLHWAPATGGAPGDEFPEYELKAAFLFHFGQFVTWPQKAFDSTDAPFVVGIAGKDPFGQLLDDTIAGKLVNKRKIVVRRNVQGHAITNCHVLFVSRSERENVSDILQAARGGYTLTVGDFERFCHLGGMINFAFRAGKPAFELNLEAAERAGLQVGSRLAERAILVKPERSEP